MLRHIIGGGVHAPPHGTTHNNQASLDIVQENCSGNTAIVTLSNKNI